MQNVQVELLKKITSLMEEFKIPYMITGAWSVIFWGRPRASHDIDFVVEVSKKDIKKTEDVFNHLSEDFSVQAGAIEDAVLEKNMFNVLHLPTMLKMDFWLLQEEPFDKSRFSRKKNEMIFGQEMAVASSEDTIVQKLRWYEESKIEKHLVDAAFVYRIQEKKLDKKYLDQWIKKLELQSLFKEMKEVKIENYL